MVKKTCICLLTAVFLLVFFSSFSQESDTASNTLKFFNKTEVGVSMGIGSFPTDVYSGTNGRTLKAKNDEIVVNLQTVNGVMYNNRWLLGVSVGIEKWRYGLFWPICGYLGYNFKRTDNTFFANIYLGYGLGTRYSTSYYNKASGAFTVTIGVGYKMKVSKNLKFGYELFYKYQALNSSYNVYHSDSTNTRWIYNSSIDYKIGLSFAGFKIAVFFP